MKLLVESLDGEVDSSVGGGRSRVEVSSHGFPADLPESEKEKLAPPSRVCE